jgi:ribose-phosphate pyrophosphokinase
LAGPAIERLEACKFEHLAVTDTIPIGRRLDRLAGRVTVLSVAPLLGEAIQRIHENRSVSELFQGKRSAR